MYVLSSLPPSQQSIAGGLFQTVTKLCMTLGYGIATALFNGVSKNPPLTGYYHGDPSWPYATVFWYSAACCALSVTLVPWLRIRTQGHGSVPDEKNHPEPVLMEPTAAEEKIG